METQEVITRPEVVKLTPEADIRMTMTDEGDLVPDQESLDAAEVFLKELHGGEVPQQEIKEPEKPAQEVKAEVPTPDALTRDESKQFIDRLVSEREASQQHIQTLVTQVNNLTALLSRQTPQNVKPEDMPDWSEILLDKERGPLFLQNFLKLMMRDQFQGVNQTFGNLVQQNAKAELETFKAKNPEILENGDIKPAVKSLLRSLVGESPNVTYEEAYNRMKKIMPSAPLQGKATTGALETTPRLSAQEIRERASRLQVESGVSARAIGNKPITTPKEAFEQAWTDVMIKGQGNN